MKAPQWKAPAGLGSRLLGNCQLKAPVGATLTRLLNRVVNSNWLAEGAVTEGWGAEEEEEEEDRDFVIVEPILRIRVPICSHSDPVSSAGL